MNTLLCLVAVAAIGWSGSELWTYWDARRQIDAACAGLVPAGRVLALSPAGGTIRHGQSDDGTIDLESGQSQKCELFSAEAREALGASDGVRWFFTAAVGVLPSETPRVPEGSWDLLLDQDGKPNHPAEPLGGGISGLVTDSDVVVELPCAKGESNGEKIEALRVRASLGDLKDAFSQDDQLTDGDRDTLAEIAVLTANNLAERLGCAERLPDPPQDIPALAEGPTPASRAHGSCAWYREAGFARQKRLADQVFESHRDGEVWDERCVLMLSEGRAKGLYLDQADRDDDGYLDLPSHQGQWFVSLHSYSGATAKNVWLRDPDPDEPSAAAAPGEAGRDARGKPVWWASSVCDGQPRIHTMTIGGGYDRLTTPAYEKVFRTYVSDTAERHSCTDTEFPAHATFTAMYAEKATS